MLVLVCPKSRRAKTRINEHGAIMKLLQVEPDKSLLESLGDSWRGEKWKGWFTDEEAELKPVKQA